MSLELLEGEADHGYGEEQDDFTEEELQPLVRLIEFANTNGDISHLLDPGELSTLGQKVCEDYEMDDASRTDWKQKVQISLNRAAQERGDASYGMGAVPTAPTGKALPRSGPWPGSCDIDYPLLTVASQQFAARAYPALVKGDEAVGVKVLGIKPPAVPDEPPPPEMAQNPQAVQRIQMLMQANAKWEEKESRAKRVKTYLNYKLFYGMEGWEDEVDFLLNQLPVTGTAFKKVYYDPDRGCCSDFVDPLRLTVAMNTKSLKRAPRITQDFDLYPYEIRQKQLTGLYRDVEILPAGEDDEASRVILEQHRLHDLDGDGVDEPYIITVDKESQQVLRIEAAFSEDDILIKDDRVVRINRWVPYVKFPFLRDPKGRFYELGFGALLEPITETLNTSINELIDAGHAQIAGGGFISGGLRLQGPGQSSALRWRPGEYKVVNSPGADLRAQIYERTLPQPSAVTFSLLDLMLTAAKDIASIKDVITGDAPSTAPVGTTMALIEQGLQVFTSIYKRVYRSFREEFQLIYQCEARWGNPEDYQQVLDDPAADMTKDFSPFGHDIVPVSDPTVVTRQQRLAKAQLIQQVAMALPGTVDPKEAAKRMLEAGDIDDIEQLLPTPQPNPMAMAEVENKKADTAYKLASADEKKASALKNVAEAGEKTGEHYERGRLDAEQRGLGGVEGEPRQPVSIPGPAEGGGEAAGGMAIPELAGGEG